MKKSAVILIGIVLNLQISAPGSGTPQDGGAAGRQGGFPAGLGASLGRAEELTLRPVRLKDVKAIT